MACTLRSVTTVGVEERHRVANQEIVVARHRRQHGDRYRTSEPTSSVTSGTIRHGVSERHTSPLPSGRGGTGYCGHAAFTCRAVRGAPMTILHQDETFDPAGPALVPDHAGDGGIAGAERNLLMAVLTDAIVHYGTSAELGRGPRPTASAEAARWILSNDRRWPFSFVNVCEALGLDPSAVRRAVTNGRVSAHDPRAHDVAYRRAPPVPRRRVPRCYRAALVRR